MDDKRSIEKGRAVDAEVQTDKVGGAEVYLCYLFGCR